MQRCIAAALRRAYTLAQELSLVFRAAWLSLGVAALVVVAGEADAQPRRRSRRRVAPSGVVARAAPARSTAAPTPTPAPPPDAPIFMAVPGAVPPNPYLAGRDARRRFGRVLEDDILATLANAPVRGNLRNYGNTSVNLRVDFPGAIDGSYKPSELNHAEHWRAEIAAFRLAQLLGIERVPPAVFRRVPQEELPTGERYGVTFERGQSWGAMIYWVPVLRPSGIGSAESLQYWSSRLAAGATIAEHERARAEEVSTLIVFDFLLANWDRWNGLNTLEDGDGRLVYRDNNAGFMVDTHSSRYLRVLHWLHQSQRFSRAIIDRARALSLEQLRESMLEDADAEHPLVTDEQLRNVLERRDVLVRYVDELVRRYGEAAVFAFHEGAP
jgi:hypothetical protein